MNPKALALELARLETTECDELLSELPEERRMQLERLVAEAAVFCRSAQDFDAHLSMTVQEPLRVLARLDDGLLRLLLGAEHPDVQRHLISGLRTGAIAGLPPAVRAVVTDFLHQKWRHSEVTHNPAAQDRRWWQSLWRR